MDQMVTFGRDDDFPSWFANALGKALSVMAHGFRVLIKDNTHVKVPAGVDESAALISIAGRWRWVEADVSCAHPGGPAGNYPLFVTAADNDIVSTPAPYTDVTDYAFALVIESIGSTPTITAGVVDIYRQVAWVVWDGAKITQIQQIVPASPSHGFTHRHSDVDPISAGDISAVDVNDPAFNMGARTAMRAHRAAAGAVGAGWSLLALDTVDSGDGALLVSSSYRAPEGGLYLVMAQVALTLGVNANVSAAIAKGGVSVVQGEMVDGLSGHVVACVATDFLQLATGDELQPAVYYDGGTVGTLDVAPTNNFLAAVRIG